MRLFGSIFLEFNLPNAATWFYFSLLLAVGLFFKFSRFLSIRNWDVITLFLLVPGLLLRQEARSQPPTTDASSAGNGAANSPTDAPGEQSNRLLWFAYLWLLCGSGVFFARCLVDLALVRRPALSPNLNLSGLAWLGGTLFVCLVAVALRPSSEPPEEKVGKPTTALEKTLLMAVTRTQAESSATGVSQSRTLFWVERGLAILGHLAVVAGLIFIGYKHFQDASAGMAAATFYLLLPYTAYHVGQFHHVWPTAFLVWVVAAYRRPTLAGGLFGVVVGTLYFPVLTLPVWLSFYRRRGAGRFTLAFLLAAGLSLTATGFMLWMNGQLTGELHALGTLSDWQPWKEPLSEGFWTRVSGAWAYRMPVFIAFLAFVLTTAFWPTPKNLAHVIALTAAILIGIQFWYADQGGVYVLWYLPLLLLLVFRPNLSDRQAPPILPEADWLARVRRALARLSWRLLGLPEPLARVQ